MRKPDPKRTPDETPLIELADARPPEFSDDALAQKFAQLYQDELRYVAPWSKWMIWEKTRWKLDNTIAAFDLVRPVCRTAAADAKTSNSRPTLATALTSAKTVAAVEKLAKADRRLAATTEQWDDDPDSFTTTWGKP
ncbi:MAG: hypothetical protein HN377_13725 [Alphaproteobacteria bacterium]|jgi:putative DNA primase/helicase|nr:hypothetical protein [Alphaproteobacteria bacterium]